MTELYQFAFGFGLALATTQFMPKRVWRRLAARNYRGLALTTGLGISLAIASLLPGLVALISAQGSEARIPTNQQEQIRIQLSTVMQAVISQLLLPRSDKPGRVAIFEVMINTPSIGALIRDNKTFRINSDIQTGAKYGMVTLDGFLMEKYAAGMISREEVITKSQDPVTTQQKLQEYELARAMGTTTGQSPSGQTPPPPKR